LLERLERGWESMKIVVAEKISDAAIRLLREEPTWKIVTPEEFAKAPDDSLRDADALIVRSAVQANKELIEKASALRIIGRAGVGVDNVDQEFATRRGIVVMNTPGANAIAVAELTIGLMLSLARFIPRAAETMRAGKWEKKSLQGSELSGKTLGIVGLGRIGIEVARRAQGMNMNVIAYDPYVSAKLARDLEVTLADLDALYASSDYISLHLGLSEQTIRMINAESLKKMKAGVRIVNCARGELIDDAALEASIKSGHVAGVALDVFTQEPPKDNSLLALPNVIGTPHIAGSTGEAQEAVGIQVVKQLREYLKNAVVQNAVNVPSLTDAEYRQLSPYMQLAERLGRLAAQLTTGNLEAIAIDYHGAVTEMKTALLRSSVTKGVLQSTSADLINVVNAVSQAEQRGLRLEEARSADGNGMAGIRVTLKTSREPVSVRGTVVHGTSAHVVEIEEIEVESPLEGNLVILRNRDVPGVIGIVGTLLGDAGVNIARFVLGRAKQGYAIAIIQTDTALSDAVLQKLRALPSILDARIVSFPSV
jgi:D-3-phosphoglycerate dehydrogenase